MRTSTAIKALLAAGALALPLASFADSQVTTGTGTITAVAHVNFQIVIPQFLSLQIGSPSAVDLLTFSPTAAQLIANSAVAGAGGTPGPGAETVTVVGNGGNVTLSVATLGQLSDGAAGDKISFATISTATSNTSLPAPALCDGPTACAGTTTVTATGKAVNQTATWTYTYTNPSGTIPAAGTYGGSAANNETATYTASMP